MPYVLDLEDIDEIHSVLVGGKAAGLGRLSQMTGVSVPPGFCVTTEAFDRVVAAGGPTLDDQLARLTRLGLDDRDAVAALSAEVRRGLGAIAVPGDVEVAVRRALARLGGELGMAVRSSATAEDLPTASFAGQQDSYLNVLGATAVLEHVRRCWASLFTERAVTYRLRNNFGHQQVRMAVIVQRMALPRAAGVLFTADPLSSNRRVITIEAGFGLGEALVSGLMAPDVFKVRDGEISTRSIAVKRITVLPRREGGTCGHAIEEQRQQQPALTDGQVTRLAQLGRHIEARLGRPQDIEWCLVDDGFAVVQSRPITTLFPIPAAEDDEPHVYVSVGHGQMMTDAMRPLGLSLWQHTTPRPMAEAGGRLFVDVARALASPASRAAVIGALGSSDPLIGDALQTIVDRGFVRPLPDDGTAPALGIGARAAIDADPAIVEELIARTQASIAAMTESIATKSGPALLDFIAEDLEDELKRDLFDPRSLQVIRAGMDAAAWLNEHLGDWLGERNAADVLTQSVSHNVTSEMGLALLDVADVLRPHEEVIAFLEQVEAEGFDDERFLAALAELSGGPEARDALRAFLARYGMRCVGEIDVTRPRWSERPTTLVPTILTHVRTFAPGAAERRFEHGRRHALEKRDDLLERLRALPDGERKASEAARMIDRVRTFAGYREHPKYGMVSRYFVYKRALLAEGDRLVDAQVLRQREDIFFLRLEELAAVVRGERVAEELLRERKDAFRDHQALAPPRVFTSEGEVITGAYRRDDLPEGALAGLPVSAGIVEGRARVVLDIAQADLEPGDILVTAFTDPSWTPVFVAIRGLVTEVGGLMTHGAVIAREYGLPAVVGVQEVTRLIRDGQRIRVHGTDGYVEVLS
jgi:phosphoenolpyruvate synthase/pyruvate phosphate dikinase